MYVEYVMIRPINILEQAPVKNTEIKEVGKVNEGWKLSFDVMIKGTIRSWTNLISFNNGKSSGIGILMFFFILSFILSKLTETLHDTPINLNLYPGQIFSDSKHNPRFNEIELRMFDQNKPGSS